MCHRSTGCLKIAVSMNYRWSDLSIHCYILFSSLQEFHEMWALTAWEPFFKLTIGGLCGGKKKKRIEGFCKNSFFSRCRHSLSCVPLHDRTLVSFHLVFQCSAGVSPPSTLFFADPCFVRMWASLKPAVSLTWLNRTTWPTSASPVSHLPPPLPPLIL